MPVILVVARVETPSLQTVSSARTSCSTTIGEVTDGSGRDVTNPATSDAIV